MGASSTRCTSWANRWELAVGRGGGGSADEGQGGGGPGGGSHYRAGWSPVLDDSRSPASLAEGAVTLLLAEATTQLFQDVPLVPHPYLFVSGVLR